MACNIVWHKRGVHLKYQGEITLNEILEVGKLLLSDRRYDNCIYEISDFSEIIEGSMSEQDVKVIGTWDKTANNFVHLRYLVMVLKDSDFFDLADMYLKMMADIDLVTKRVDTYDEAVAFLNKNDIEILK